MFKVGDKVKWIAGQESKYWVHKLIDDKTYTVTKMTRPNSLFIYLDGDKIKAYSVSRFELVESKKMPMATTYSGLFEPTHLAAITKQPHKCSCVFRDLLMNGCKCGGI